MTAKMKAPTFKPLETKEAAEIKAKATKRQGTAKKAAPKVKPSGQPPASITEPVECPFPVRYERGKGRYWYQEESGRWEGKSVEQFRRRLKIKGISGRCEEGAIVSPHDRIIDHVEQTLGVDYCGPLAGYMAGVYQFQNAAVLVSVSPCLLTPCAGEWQTLRAYLSQLFGAGHDSNAEKQMLTFCLWIARAFRSIAEQRVLAGQALILAGPRGNGKTLLQEEIITAMLGGRMVKARGWYLDAQAKFNVELFKAEHHVLSDENASRDYRARREFGQKIKDAVANNQHSCHPKHVDSITLPARWRLSISVNDEAEHLQTLPPISDKDIADKVHLFQTYQADIPADDDERAAWLARLMAEIPAFLFDALKLDVPAEMKEGRFGVKAFRHPYLLAQLNSFSPEVRLLEIVDELLFWDTTPDPWQGNATELRAALLEKAEKGSPLQREIESLLSGPAITGQYLNRLADAERHGDRVTNEGRKESGTKRSYQIKPPGGIAS